MKIKLLLGALFATVFSWGQIYQHNFGATTITAHPYNVVPTIIDANLNSSSWVNSTGAWTSFAGSAGQAISLNNSGGTPSITLTFNVAAGYQMSVTQFNFWRQRSAAGAQNWSMTINGISVGSGTVPTAGTSVGNTNVTNAITNLTGAITVVLNLSGASGAGTFRLDDFTLLGTVTTTSTNTITTNTALVGSPFCVSASTGATVSVPFTSVGTFNAGNVYTAQLSNAAGSFAIPVSIGTVTSTLNTAVILATIPAGTTAGTGYRIRVVSSNPVVTGSDNTVNLTVQNAAAITTQPSTTVQNLCQNAAATPLSVTATGTTLSYQWYSNLLNSNTGGTAVGTNSASYTPVTTTAGTLYYYCVVTAACGTSVTSNVSGAVNVTSVPSAPVGTINISANPSCGAASLTYSAPNANIYWQTTATGTSTANPTTSSLSSPATAGTYVRYVRELNGTCWSPATASASFTIVEPVAISVQPPNRVITDGTNTTFAVTASGTTPTYQWQVDTGGGFVNLTNGAPYSNVTTATLNITAATIAMHGYLYRCIISGAAPCGSVISNSGSLTVALTPPNNPTNIVPCYGNNTLELSWTAATSGVTPAPDGYMVFAFAGATIPSTTSALAGNSSLYTANSDFSLAATVTPALGKCLYKGTGTSFTVTGLTNLSNYSFKVVAYRGTTGTAWSSGINTTGSWSIPTTNITIDIPEVSALAASIASGQSAVTWTRPTPLSCYDEYLVVANQGTVVFTPIGDGTAYTANNLYTGSNQVVYKGTGAGITVSGLTNGLSYCYKVFVRRGTEWSDGVSVCQTPNLLYCASGATSNLDSEIENVTLVGYSTTISNNTTNVCTTGVNNYTAMSADLQVGGTYTVAVAFGDCSDGTQYDGAGGVWIDWNNDGDFLDLNETIGTALVAVSAGNVIQNFTINVPGGQPVGNYRMRIVQTESATLGTLNPCGTFTYGSTEDYTVQVVTACVPTQTVSSFTPTSGPVGTEVTINGTGLSGTTVTFSGITASIVSSSSTQLVVVIPAGATTGIVSVKDSQPCAIDNMFTIIVKDNASCEGTAATTDLIIYDVHDEQSGSGGFITLYNGTAASVNLSNYSIWRTSTHDDGNEVNYANLTGSIAPGALGILKVSVGSCGPASTNGTINGGFNENDGIQLRNAAGSVVIDDVDAYPTAPGYYMVRNTGALNARVSYVAADWSTIPLAAGVCYPSAGITPPTAATPPLVTMQPSYLPSCGATSAILNTVGTEGFSGGFPLAYQWYAVAPGNATWSAVTDGGIYSGATTASLTIATISTVLDYQYYCQIRENVATCYTASNAVKIKDTSASTWNGATWIGGIPSLTKAAIIDGDYITATHGNFSCCSLTVNATRSLTISANGTVEVQNGITNNGTFTVLSDGSLVQISDAGVNTGAISYNRNTNIRRLDYVYWSSPVANFASSAISPATTLGFQYLWTPTIGSNSNGFGNWGYANETMVLGKGYAVRGPNTFAYNTLANYTATFTGVPNNGIVTLPITRGTWNGGTYSTGVSTTLGTNEDDNWNLVGNPYPSAINAIDFLTVNPNLDGFVNIWTHGTLPTTAIVDPFYNNYVYNYTASDYITYNASGASSGPGVFNGRIAGGQGFFVSMLPTTASTAETITFNNSLRSTTYNNGQFFRSTSAAVVNEDLERNRIWLDLVSPAGSSSRAMVGYIENATDAKDRLFDAFSNQKLNFNIFSLIDSEPMLIQGRKVPFDIEDKVNIGITIPQEGLYKIAISAVDGLFTNLNQNIYLEDKLLNVIYDLRAAPYEFSANKGTITDRFVIRYATDAALGNETFTSNHEVVVVSNQELSISTSQEKMDKIIVFDVLGRKLFEGNNLSSTQFTVPISKREAPILIEIHFEDGTKSSKKTIF